MSDHQTQGEFRVIEHPDGTIEEGLTPESAPRLLGSTEISARDLRARLDEYLRGVFAQKMEDMNLDAMIVSQVERRIEVAAKVACGNLSTQAVAVAAELLRKRVASIVAGMEIKVIVECEQQRDQA